MIQTRTDTYVKWEYPVPRTGETPRFEKVAIYDLDDTLAWYCKERRLPGCADFAPTPLLARALEAQAEGTGIILASARPEWCADGTFAWCARHGLSPIAVYLKNRRCMLPAHELKKAMLMNILSNHQEIKSFHDDSPWNCAVARDLKIPTFFVSGNEEYWLSKGARENWDLDIAEFCPMPVCSG